VTVCSSDSLADWSAVSELVAETASVPLALTTRVAVEVTVGSTVSVTDLDCSAELLFESDRLTDSDGSAESVLEGDPVTDRDGSTE
jgi:hypothetical protein